MALTITKSIQFAADRQLPIEDHGKLRFKYFDCLQGAAAGDDGSQFELGQLPFGRIRILPWMCTVSGSAYGAARVLKFGHHAYQKEGGIDEAENLAAFGSGIDISGATNLVRFSATVVKYDIFSRKGPLVVATVTGGTIPAAATLKGFIAYIHE